MPKLRRVDFHTLDEVITDIRNLRDKGYEQGGNWNLSQMCEHLGGTIRIGLDGTMKPLPWILRATVGNLMFWLFTRRLTRGINGIGTLPDLVPAEAESHNEALIDECLATMAEARDTTKLEHPYPLTTSVTLDKWQLMMVVHSQHHLEFLKPKE